MLKRNWPPRLLLILSVVAFPALFGIHFTSQVSVKAVHHSVVHANDAVAVHGMPQNLPAQNIEPAPSLALTPTTTEESSNWAGWVVAGGNGSATAVQSTFTIPTANCTQTPNSYDAFWGGIDGWGNDTVEQTGVEVECSGTTPVYFTWYELYPGGVELYPSPITVSPGNVILTTVFYEGSGEYYMAINDGTTGQAESTTVSAPGVDNATAECIAEDPGAPQVFYAQYAQLNFSQCVVNGSAIGTFAGAFQTIMLNTWSQTATPGGLSGNTAFAVGQNLLVPNSANGHSSYASGADGAVWQNNFLIDRFTDVGEWTGWSSLGNGGVSLTSGVGVGQNQADNPNLFATGTDGNVWQDYWTGQAWSGWSSLGHGTSNLTSGVADGINQDNNQNLFATGADGNIWQNWFVGPGWSGWSSLGHGTSNLTSGVAVGHNQANNQNLFATGADGNVWQNWFVGPGWSGWSSLGHGTSSLTSGVADGRNQDDNQNLFATGADGNVWQNWFVGPGWSGWSSLGHGTSNLTSGIASAPNFVNNQNIFASGADGTIWQNYWTGSGWSGWGTLGNGGVSLLSGVAAR